MEALTPPRGADSTTEGTFGRLLSLLLLEMDAVVRSDGPPLLLLGATREREDLDPAILRHGRLDVHVHVAKPSAVQRRGLLAHMLKRTPVDWDEASGGKSGSGGNVSMDVLDQLTDGFNLAQLSAICREAAMTALREDIEATKVRAHHFDAAAPKSRAVVG